jgi:hypothetical protein
MIDATARVEIVTSQWYGLHLMPVAGQHLVQADTPLIEIKGAASHIQPP